MMGKRRTRRLIPVKEKTVNELAPTLGLKIGQRSSLSHLICACKRLKYHGHDGKSRNHPGYGYVRMAEPREEQRMKKQNKMAQPRCNGGSPASAASNKLFSPFPPS